MALSFGILFRYGFFFALHFSIAVFMFLPVLKTQMRVMYKFAIFLLISYSTFSIINSNKVYIPYTNYFMYLFNEKCLLIVKGIVIIIGPIFIYK